MTTFDEKLREAKKNLKASSVETYLRNIRRLRKVHEKLPIPADSHKWLLKKVLFKWFDDQPLKIRRHMATAAVVALKVFGVENKDWAKRQNQSMKEFDEQRNKRELTDAQKKLVPTKGFAALKRVVQTMKRVLQHLLKKPNTEWTFAELMRIQDLIIISCYENYPLRLDYATLKTEKSESENCIYKKLKKPRGYHITLFDFKTSKTLGPKTFKLSAANQRLLNKFVPAVKRLTEHGFFLSNRDKHKLSKQSLSKHLLRITKKHLSKSFSVQFLRILFAMQNRGIITSAAEVAEKLLHDPKQSLKYAKK